MAALDNTLDRKLTPGARSAILQVLFKPAWDANLAFLEGFFNYYESELSTLSLGKWSRTTQSPGIAISTHADLLFVVQSIQAGGSSTKTEIRKRLKHRFLNADDSALDRSIDLSMRLWLMINIRENRLRLQTPRTPVIVWRDDWTFRHLLDHTFPTPRWELGAKDSRLHPAFTASFMVEVCGLKLEWTDCLADHLRLDRREKVLQVYPHKAFLQYHLDAVCRSDNLGELGLPEALLKETITSLNLLFPQWEPATNKLLKRHGQNFQLQAPYNVPKSLNLVEFEYWRDRLLEVYDVIFLSPPASWAQLWRDRRNPQQFWTFWIAMVILAMTSVSMVTGIVQAWASVKSLRSSSPEPSDINSTL